MSSLLLEQYWKESAPAFHPVVPFDKGYDVLGQLDLSVDNADLTESVYGDQHLFQEYLQEKYRRSGGRYLVGGYGELRKIYSISPLFGSPLSLKDSDESAEEPRRLHLGLDIWGAVGTPVHAPAQGKIHSLAWNGAKGDYGGTIIVVHQAKSLTWHTLYGHLSKASLVGKRPGDVLEMGRLLGEFGVREENGGWPPHLHFQVILDLCGNRGDYPGVCRHSEKEAYLANCPDPEQLLQWEHRIR
jgi:peptidoglycan LD-endopeptidase LytH